MTAKAKPKSTNIELDRDLLAKAQKTLGNQSIKETVEEGLRRIVAESALQELAAQIGEMRADPEQRELMNNVRNRAW